MGVQKYTPEVGGTICEVLATGKMLPEACKKAGVGVDIVWKWLAKYPDFRESYMLAREVQAEVLAAEVITIADDATGDFKTVEGKNGKMYNQIDYENINRARLRCDSRKWTAAHLMPKRFGDYQKVEVSGTVDLASSIAAGKKRAEGTE